MSTGPAFLFDLDGTFVDSVYPHVLAWRQALEAAGIELAVWRIHRRVGMSGGLFVNALLGETGRPVTAVDAERIQRRHGQAYARQAHQVRPIPGARGLLASLSAAGWACSRAPTARTNSSGSVPTASTTIRPACCGTWTRSGCGPPNKAPLRPRPGGTR